MALFSKKNRTPAENGRGSDMPITSIISSEMQVNGDITFKGKARIDGAVQGDIRGEYLVISESGRIRGNLELGTLICHGRVEGDIKADVITAHGTANINGCLAADNLTVEAGATLEGEIKAAHRQQTPASAPATKDTKGDTGKKKNPATPSPKNAA